MREGRAHAMNNLGQFISNVLLAMQGQHSLTLCTPFGVVMLTYSFFRPENIAPDVETVVMSPRSTTSH